MALSPWTSLETKRLEKIVKKEVKKRVPYTKQYLQNHQIPQPNPCQAQAHERERLFAMGQIPSLTMWMKGFFFCFSFLLVESDKDTESGGSSGATPLLLLSQELLQRGNDSDRGDLGSDDDDDEDDDEDIELGSHNSDTSEEDVGDFPGLSLTSKERRMVANKQLGRLPPPKSGTKRKSQEGKDSFRQKKK